MHQKNDVQKDLRNCINKTRARDERFIIMKQTCIPFVNVDEQSHFENSNTKVPR